MRKSASGNYIETKTWNTKDLAVGSELEGRYVTSKNFISKFDKSATTTMYVIEGKDGTNYGVFSTASLARQFANVPEGSYVWITYKGEEPTKNGRTVKVFDVDYDPEA